MLPLQGKQDCCTGVSDEAMTVARPATRRSRALVTGGAGFIGSHLCERLLFEGYKVVCMDNLSTGVLENVEPFLVSEAHFEIIDHDVSIHIDFPGDLDEIYHFASAASPADFGRIPVEILKTGALGTHNCLGLARARGARFMLASTSEVYGDPLVHPQREDYRGNVSTTGPRSVYGEATQTRSVQYVEDLIEGVIRLMRSEETRPVNIGNPVEYSVREVAGMIIELCGSPSEISHQPLPEDDPKQRCPDITRAREVLGWEPQTQAPEGLAKTLDWFASVAEARSKGSPATRGESY